MTSMEKLALAGMIAGAGRLAGGMGRGAGGLGMLGAGIYGVHQAGRALKSFNPQNPAMIGENMRLLPSRTKSYQDDLGQVMAWAQNPTGR